MKEIKTGWVLALLLCFVVMSSCNTKHAVKHVVLISLDGARPEFYLDSSWHMPNLQKLKQEGVYTVKGVKSVFPSLTYPSHTSMVTGAYPFKHGIYNNKPYKGIPGQWLSDEKDIKAKTLWDVVKEAGMTSGAVMWPVTVGAPIDYNFPERFPMEGEEDKNVLTIKYPYLNPPSLLSDIERSTGRQFTPEDLSTKNNYAESKTIALISNYIIKTYQPNLMGIHLIAMDHQQHAHGTDAPEVREAVRVTDSLIGTIIQTIKDAGIWENTAVIFIGDHGHTNTLATFAPNVYLAKHGLINKNGWKAKFHAAGGSSFLYLKDKKNAAIIDSVSSILENTPEYQKGYFRILRRDTLNKMGAAANTRLAIAMKEGITVRNGSTGEAFTKKDGTKSTHGYDPAYKSMYTAFVASGAGIAKDQIINNMEVVDIAPLVTELFDLEFNTPDGRLIPGIIAE